MTASIAALITSKKMSVRVMSSFWPPVAGSNRRLDRRQQRDFDPFPEDREPANAIISIGPRALRHELARVSLTIRDTGIGMSSGGIPDALQLFLAQDRTSLQTSQRVSRTYFQRKQINIALTIEKQTDKRQGHEKLTRKSSRLPAHHQRRQRRSRQG